MSLEVNITKKLGNFTLHAILSADNCCTGILGASGCGKSMFLKCIAGIETPDSGSIVLDGKVLYDSEKKINLPPQKRNVGYLFQNYALFPSMTVRQNIAAGINAGKKEKRSKAETEKIVDEMIRLCRLEGLENQYPTRLSGGQQQRTALARMLAVNPDIIMLDEPFSALDSHLKEAMQREMAEIIQAYKGNVLIVSHSRDELYRLCDNLYVMNKGEFTRNGAIKEVFQSPDNTEAAILTGCKNIARAERKDAFTLNIPSWGIEMKRADSLPEGITHVGIRAHYFYPVTESGAIPDGALVFTAKIHEMDDRPFEYDYYLKTSEEKDTILWNLSKAADRTYELSDEVQLFVRQEDIMLLTE